MIIFFAQGRLGNQLFQYAFMQTIRSGKEKIITVGLEELCNVFKIKDVINFKKHNKYVTFFYYNICYPFFEKVSRAGLFTEIAVDNEIVLEKYTREANTYRKKSGLLSKMRFLKTGFFQSEKIIDISKVNNLEIHETYLCQAKKILEEIIPDYYTVFVHIRLGDYTTFSFFGKSVVLPLSFYYKQIEWFKQNRENVFFVFLSDDPDKAEKLFDKTDNCIFVKDTHAGVDFAIMTLCKGGIMSPSSFSWWGSYFMKNRDIVFGPKYWLGFNSKIESAEGACPSFAIQIEVD